MTTIQAEWEAVLIPAGVPCSAINDVAELKRKFPEVFVTVDHPTAGPSLQAGAPFAFSASPLDYAARAPLLGEHTREVLLDECGFSAAELSAWQKEGAVYARA